MKNRIPFLDVFNMCLDKYLISSNRKGIAEGEGGVLLCLAYLYHYTEDEYYYNKLNEICDTLINEQNNDFSLGKGLTGLAWAISHTKEIGLVEDEFDNWNRVVEGVLLKRYNELLHAGNLDYFSGAMGILYYFIKRNSNEELVKKVSDSWTNVFVHKIEEDEWKSPFYSSEEKKYCNNINLSVPHGLTGYLLMLLLIKEYTTKDITHLIRRMTNILLRFRRPDQCGRPYFPYQIWEDERSSYSGIHWCHGDLMAGYAILKAGVLLDDVNYQDVSKNILSNTLNHSLFHDQKLALCHGYTSLTFIYDEIFKITKDMSFHLKSKYWETESAKEFKVRYERYCKTAKYSDFFENPSLLIGFPGFFLSVLSWECDEYNKWTSCLLL